MEIILLVILIILFCIFRKKVFRGGGDIIKDLSHSPRTKSEARVVSELEDITKEKFPTVLPEFMQYNNKRLELDGYCEKLRVALEFSGPLHTKWFPEKESYARYISRVETDELKKMLCKNAGVDLIVVDMRLPSRHLRDYLRSRLFDFGKGPRPDNYLSEQPQEAWRR